MERVDCSPETLAAFEETKYPMVLMTSQQTPDPLMRLKSVEEHAKKAIAVTERAVGTPAVCDVSTPPLASQTRRTFRRSSPPFHS